MKDFVLDTCVLLENPKYLFSLPNINIILPYEVILELENHKTKEGLVGKNARETIRQLELLRKQNSLTQGVELENGSRISIENPISNLDCNDMKIITTAKIKKAILITSDIAMRIKANLLNVIAEEPFHKKEGYYLPPEIDLTEEKRQELFSSGFTSLEEEYSPNDFLITKGCLGLYQNGFKRIPSESPLCFGIKPRNKEQRYALHVLNDSTIPLVSITGKAGTGKTLLAIASALEMTLEQKIYSKIIISRPLVGLGKDIGFLPGTLEDKLKPWLQPIYDSLNFLLRNKNAVNHLFDIGIIDLQALTHIRGRSMENIFFIVDEAQNLSKKEAKAIVTRMGKNSKLVLTGDLEQTDLFEKEETGLFHVLSKTRFSPLSSNIQLNKGERSPLAELGTRVL